MCRYPKISAFWIRALYCIKLPCLLHYIVAFVAKRVVAQSFGTIDKVQILTELLTRLYNHNEVKSLLCIKRSKAEMHLQDKKHR